MRETAPAGNGLAAWRQDHLSHVPAGLCNVSPVVGDIEYTLFRRSLQPCAKTCYAGNVVCNVDRAVDNYPQRIDEVVKEALIGGSVYKTIQMTLDENLLEQVDATSNQLGLSRSAFIRAALRKALEQVRISELEQKHAVGYARRPIEPGEFDVWEAEQSWGEA